MEFQSTPPARRATHRRAHRPRADAVSIHAPRAEGDSAGSCTSIRIPSFNPRPPRGGRQAQPDELRETLVVSIHAPRAEGDRRAAEARRYSAGVSIHAPRAEGDAPARGGAACVLEFQSTPPARRATVHVGRFGAHLLTVSIHAPRAEGDSTARCRATFGSRFQSTPPARRATYPSSNRATLHTFQSTPPARRATSVRRLIAPSGARFNPRPPRGGRPPSL